LEFSIRASSRQSVFLKYLDAGAALPLALFWLRKEITRRNRRRRQSDSAHLLPTVLRVAACHADAADFMQVALFILG
jgi:hypothetical protein